MEDWHFSQISFLVKYRHSQTKLHNNYTIYMLITQVNSNEITQTEERRKKILRMVTNI